MTRRATSLEASSGPSEATRHGASFQDLVELTPSGRGRGLAVSAGGFMDAMRVIGSNELSIDRLAAELPTPTEHTREVLEQLIGTDQRSPLLESLAIIALAARAVTHVSSSTGS